MRNTIILNYSLDWAIWKFKFSGFFLNVIFHPFIILYQCREDALAFNDFRECIRVRFRESLLNFAIITFCNSVSGAEKIVYTSATLNVQKKTPQSKVKFGISGRARSGKLAILAQSEIKCSPERSYDTCSPNRSNVSYDRQVK